MKTSIKAFFFLLCLVFYIQPAQAAKINQLWGSPAQYQKILSEFQMPPIIHNHILDNSTVKTDNNQRTSNALVPVGNINHKKHIRFSQQFQGIPILGHQVIIHRQNLNKFLITGVIITELESDLITKSYAVNKKKAQRIIKKKDQNAKIISVIKKIYIDKNNESTAHYVYEILYKSHINNEPSLKKAIIDANDGQIIKSWSEMHKYSTGSGLGGVDFNNLE